MFMSLPGFVVPGFAPICVDSNDPLTVANGVYKRMMRDLPSPDLNQRRKFFKFVRRWAARHIPAVDPLSFEEWLERSSYNEARKQELRAVEEGLRGGMPSRKKCSQIKSFVKTEAYTEIKHARMINARCDAFKVISGPFFSALESVVYALPPFIKHTPVPERPSRIMQLQRDGCRVYATDFTAFESHFEREFMLNVECAVYRVAFRKYPAISKLILESLTGRNQCSTRMGLRYSVVARRMSGDMCTSLGNGLTNYLLAAFIARDKGHVLNGVVEGDDGLFVTDARLTTDDYAKLGFTIKMDEFTDVRDAGFCQMYFDNPRELVKSIYAVLHKFSWTHSFLGAGVRIQQELLRAKALSGVYETPQCPILGVLYREALEATRGVAARFVYDGYHSTVPHDTMKIPSFNPSQQTREFYARKFGIPVQLQLEVESAIRNRDMTTVSRILPPPHADMLKYWDLYVEGPGPT